MSPIPDDELISAYLDDELSREERLRAEQLLLDRADLRRLFEELRGLRDGLRSLPKFSLGEEFSSLVLKKAERSVLQSGTNAEESPRTNLPTTEPVVAAVDAVPVPPIVASTAAAAESVPTIQASSPPAVPPVMPARVHERSRLVRPIIWSLTAVAAALALMIYEQGRFFNSDMALKTNEAPTAPAAMKASPRPTSGESAGNALHDATTNVEEAKKTNHFARHSDGPALANSVVLGTTTSTSTAAAMSQAPQPAPTTMAPLGGSFLIQNGAALGASATIASKSGAGTLTLSAGNNSYSGASLVTVLGSDKSSEVDADSLEGIVQQDRKRGELLASNFLKLQSDHPDAPVDAGQLQKLATLEQLGRASNLGLNGLAGNSLAGNTIDAQRRKQADSYGSGTAAPTQAPAGAGTYAGGAGVGTGNGAMGNVGLVGNNLNIVNGSFANYGDNNLLVVVCEVTPEALDNFAPLLRDNQIADYSFGSNAEADGRALGRATTQVDGRKLAKSQATNQGAVQPNGAIRAPSSGSSKAGPAVPGLRPGDRDVADGGRGMNNAGIAVNGGTLNSGTARGGTAGGAFGGTPAAKAEAGAIAGVGKNGDSQDGGSKNGDGKAGSDKSADAKYFAAKNLGDRNGKDVEFFYVVANREQLEETLKKLREEPQYFLNVNVEPATAEVAESARWRGYNRGNAAVAMPPAAPAAVAAKPTGPSPTVKAPAVAAASAATQPVAPATALPAGVPASASVGQQKMAQADNARRAYESQQQRRAFSMSRVQRFNVDQIESGRLNYAAEQNLAAEKAKAFYDNDPAARQAGARQPGTPKPNASTSDVAKKDDVPKPVGVATIEVGLPPRRESPTKEAAPPATAAKTAPASEVAPVAAPTAAATPALVSVSGMKPAEAKLNDLKPGNPTPAETQSLAKDEADLRSRQVKLGLPAGDAPTVTAPSPTTPISAVQQAEPEQVLGKIVGAQQPPPIVQQSMPPLQQNRIRGTALAETTQQEALQQQVPQQQVQQVELPPGYHEALFIFRVVKRAPNESAPAAGESDSTTKPTGK